MIYKTITDLVLRLDDKPDGQIIYTERQMHEYINTFGLSEQDASTVRQTATKAYERAVTLGNGPTLFGSTVARYIDRTLVGLHS